MSVRAFFTSIKVDSAEPPYDSLYSKIYYPGNYGDSAEERNMGYVPADQALAPFPVAILMPGSNCPPESYAWLARFLASNGIVAMVYGWVKEDMPGYVALSPGFDLSGLMPDTYGSKPSAPAIPYLLGELQRQNSSGVLAGLLDLNSIILGGHSAGGNASLLNSNNEWFPSIKAGFSYAAHSGAATAIGYPKDTLLPLPSNVPFLIMGGTRDGVIAASSNRYGDEVDASPTHRIARTFDEAMNCARGDSHLLLIEGANHFCFLDPDDGTTGRPFLDWSCEQPAETRAFLGEAIYLFIKASVNGDTAAFKQLTTLASDNPLVAEYRNK